MRAIAFSDYKPVVASAAQALLEGIQGIASLLMHVTVQSLQELLV